MRPVITIFTVLFAFITSSSARSVSQVFGFPSAEPGYSLGVSACYAGRIGDWLVMAGGCNFPVPGNKTYYAGIYAARIDGAVLNWRLVGMLPEPAAYGATVQSGDSLVFIGGNNKEHGLATVYSIHLNATGDEASVSRMPGLPLSVDNMAVAVAKGKVCLFGGNHDGSPSSVMLVSSLSGGMREWRSAGEIPGGTRVQPVCAAYGSGVYVWGGFHAAGENSVVHTDGYRFDVATGEWLHLDPPHGRDGVETTLSGGVAWTEGNHIVATGGVNRDIFLDAISGRYERVKKEDYLSQPIVWYRFSGNLYVFDVAKAEWTKDVFADRSLARAGAQAVVTSIGTFYIGGELKPALRTPQIVLVSEGGAQH